jgi:voltage-gated potassium channel
MSDISRFKHYLFHALWKIRAIVFGLSAILLVDAVAIAYFEKMPFADALYFTFVTGLTIGYGDIVPVTLIGRVVAILTGLQGVLITGLTTAVAVYALRKSIEHPTDSK